MTGMYPVYSMANHSCCASAMAVVGGGSTTGYELQLRAQVPIKKVQCSRLQDWKEPTTQAHSTNKL